MYLCVWVRAVDREHGCLPPRADAVYFVPSRGEYWCKAAVRRKSDRSVEKKVWVPNCSCLSAMQRCYVSRPSSDGVELPPHLKKKWTN